MIPGITAGARAFIGGGGGGDGLWTPQQILTQLWFDASDATTVTIATGVSQLRDKSGNARHVAQATGANQPTRGVVSLNSLPVLSYDGSNDSLIGTANLAGLAQNVPQISYYTVRRFTGIGGVLFPVCFTICDGDAPDGLSTRFGHYCSESDAHERPAGQRLDGQSLEVEDSGSITNNLWQMFTTHVLYAAANQRAYRDGLSVMNTGHQDAGSTSNTAPSAISVGSWNDGSLSMRGDIAEIIVTHTVDPPERILIEGYAAWKWGLQANLPVTHRFKSAAPLITDVAAMTSSLLHFDGADTSTTITDERGNTWTASGNAQLSTAVKKFGVSSLLLDGTGDFVTMSPALAIGAGDYTLEAFMRWTARSGNNFVFSFGAGWGVYTFADQWAVFDGAVSNILGPFGGVADNVQFHVALVREQGVLSLYIDGLRKGTVADSTDHVTAFLRLGAQPSGAGASTGNIDEFRFSNLARYSGAVFTPPTAAFSS